MKRIEIIITDKVAAKTVDVLCSTPYGGLREKIAAGETLRGAEAAASKILRALDQCARQGQLRQLPPQDERIEITIHEGPQENRLAITTSTDPERLRAKVTAHAPITRAEGAAYILLTAFDEAVRRRQGLVHATKMPTAPAPRSSWRDKHIT